MCLDLVVQAGAQAGVGTNLPVSYGYMFGVDGIGAEGSLVCEGAVEHDVGVGAVEVTVHVDLDVDEPWDAAFEAFQSGLDALLHCLLLFGGEFFSQSPEDNVFYHIIYIK